MKKITKPVASGAVTKESLTEAKDAALACVMATCPMIIPLRWTMAREAFENGTKTGEEAASIRKFKMPTMTEREYWNEFESIISEVQAKRDRYDAVVSKAIREHILISSAGRKRPIAVMPRDATATATHGAAAAHEAARAAITMLLSILVINRYSNQRTASEQIKNLHPLFDGVVGSMNWEVINTEIKIEFGLAVTALTTAQSDARLSATEYAAIAHGEPLPAYTKSASNLTQEERTLPAAREERKKQVGKKRAGNFRVAQGAPARAPALNPTNAKPVVRQGNQRNGF